MAQVNGAFTPWSTEDAQRDYMMTYAEDVY